MTKLQIKSVAGEWRETVSRKLSQRNKVQRALLLGQLNALVDQKQRLEFELLALDRPHNDIRTDYQFKKCDILTGNIG